MDKNISNDKSIQREIQREYEASFIFPRQKLKRQFLLCPVGLVGAGKTTVIKPLSKKLSLLRISTDEIRRLFREKKISDNGDARKIAYASIKKYVHEGWSIAIDADCGTPHARKNIEDTKSGKENKLKVIWIYINPPEDFILHKLRNFKHTWLFRDGEQAVENYLTKKSQPRDLEHDFIYTFDTSQPNLLEQIKEAEILIRKAIE